MSSQFTQLLAGKIGTQELLIILLIVVILFGPSQLPKLTKMFGKSIRNFRQGMTEEEDSASAGEEAPDKKA